MKVVWNKLKKKKNLLLEDFIKNKWELILPQCLRILDTNDR